MPAQVKLNVVRGKLKGEQFVFDERDTCIIGRSKECRPQIPNDDDHRTISRHHCLLDISLPEICVRDFGSRNGTYVNGTKIGQRDPGQSAEEAKKGVYKDRDLVDGDRIRIGKTVFQVSVLVPEVCSACGVEIPEEQAASARRASGELVCPECRLQVEPVIVERSVQQHVSHCIHCGREGAAEAGRVQQGEYVCTHCQTDVLGLVKDLLGLAKSKRTDLLAIEGFTILRKLGQGGMGAAFLALDDKDREKKVLKVMLPNPGVAVNEHRKNLFLHEADIGQQLEHPHVVRQLDHGYSNGTFYIVQEYCELGSLDQVIKAQGPQSIDYAIPLILQVLDGLEYAHRAEVRAKLKDGQRELKTGVVHRDLKPHNIFLRGDEQAPTPLIGDFGLAKAFDAAGLSGRTLTGAIAGTPDFMCRQQVINFKYAKPDVDVWAVAATLYNLLTKECPRDLGGGKEPCSTILATQPTPIRERNRSIPPRLAEVIDTALRDKSQLTFKSARELKDALEGAV